MLARPASVLLLVAVAAAVAAPAAGHPLAETLEEASPYLRRFHAGTPVRWRVWDGDLWATARRTGRPVFVTVGYAACWWCHRFQRESLRDPAVVELLERRFLPVVVDREAQPEVDDWLQAEAARLGAPRGWPLQVILTPEAEPVAAFGYRPPRRGPFGPGTLEVLEAALARAVHPRADDGVETVAVGPGDGAVFDWDLWATLARRLRDRGDPFHGGFGESSKKLWAPALEAVWRYALRFDDGEAHAFVVDTLATAVRGAAFDHPEGGFFRYLADPAWREPHFEKMLYTQAQWVRLLALVHARTGDPVLADRIRRTVAFARRRLRLPSGLYAGSLDAESAGGEGGWYRFDEAAIRRVLGPVDAARLFAAFALDARGVLHLREDAEETPALRPLLRRLAMARARRPPPPRDDKAVLAWNALWAEALIRAGRILDETDWVDEGIALARTLAVRFRRGEGFARWLLAGRALGRADVEDLAMAGLAALAAFENTADPGDLAAARRFAAAALESFDGGRGVFGRRPAPGRFVPALGDGETMAANARAALLLARLFHLEGREEDRELATRALLAALPALREDPLRHAGHLLAYEELRGALQVVVVAVADDPAAEDLLARVWRAGLPNAVIQRVGDTTRLPLHHPAHGKTRVDGRATAYVCSGPVCSLPAIDPEGLAARLETFRRIPPGGAGPG